MNKKKNKNKLEKKIKRKGFQRDRTRNFLMQSELLYHSATTAYATGGHGKDIA